MHFTRYAVVVTVDTFTDVSIEGDEVCGTEDQVLFGDANRIVFTHGELHEKMYVRPTIIECNANLRDLREFQLLLACNSRRY